MTSLIVTLIILGVVFYFVDMIPMADPFPRIIKVIAIILAVLLVLRFLGVATGINLN